MNTKMASLRKTVVSPDDSEGVSGLDNATRLHEDNQFVLATTRGK